MANLLQTELIMEVAKGYKNSKGFSCSTKKLKYNIEQHTVSILTDAMAEKIGRDKGTYLTLKFDELLQFDTYAKNYLCKAMYKAIKILLKTNNIKPKKTLIVGLGNEKFACDSLGKMVVDKILITKPFLDRKLFDKSKLSEVYAINFGVYGTTGLDSCEVIKNICNFLHPDLIIVVDSLVAGQENSLCKSLQLSNTKLVPGGGVGNSRQEFSYENLGVRIIAIGVPLVLNTHDFCKNINLVVTPKDVEKQVSFTSKIIAKAINLALNNLTEQELMELLD